MIFSQLINALFHHREELLLGFRFRIEGERRRINQEQEHCRIFFYVSRDGEEVEKLI